MRIRNRIFRSAFTLLELMAVVVIIGAIAAIVMPRISTSRSEASEKSCYHNRLMINSAIERFALETGAYPSALSDLNVPDYFPEGIPPCPASGSPYTMNAQYRVDGHAGGVHP